MGDDREAGVGGEQLGDLQRGGARVERHRGAGFDEAYGRGGDGVFRAGGLRRAVGERQGAGIRRGGSAAHRSDQAVLSEFPQVAADGVGGDRELVDEGGGGDVAVLGDPAQDGGPPAGRGSVTQASGLLRGAGLVSGVRVAGVLLGAQPSHLLLVPWIAGT
ncbi:hypothetical protein GCM10020001_093340 [Nonomuraea salmonea]